MSHLARTSAIGPTTGLGSPALGSARQMAMKGFPYFFQIGLLTGVIPKGTIPAILRLRLDLNFAVDTCRARRSWSDDSPIILSSSE